MVVYMNVGMGAWMRYRGHSWERIAEMAIGMSLPFLLLGFVPALRRLLPKPGKWMERFRRIMAVPMALTALGLGWLTWRIGGAQYAAVAVAIAVILLAALAAIGLQQRKSRPVGALAAVSALIMIGGVLGLPPPAPMAIVEEDLLGSQPFSEAALAEARRNNLPVFLYFTADWCLSCKVNEKVAIQTDATDAAFRIRGVVVMRAAAKRQRGDGCSGRGLTDRSGTTRPDEF